MANHPSALKRIRQTAVRRLRNRYQLKTTKTLIKRLRTAGSAGEARKMLPEVVSRIDKLVKRTSFIGIKRHIKNRSSLVW